MRKKVIVVGTTFGQLYLRAIDLAKERFKLVGIVASGSKRSKECAEKYSVPLYTDIKDIPDDIDYACVVVRSEVLGGKGTEIALKLLNKGINVLQEHPIHPNNLRECYKTAKENNVHYQTGSLYLHIPEIDKFVKASQYINKNEKAVYIRMSFSSQVSYAAIEILLQVLSCRHVWKFKGKYQCGPFVILNGEIGDIPVSMEVHNEVNPNDPNNHMYLLHCAQIVYKSGRLNLVDTFGPVIWNPKMYTNLKYAKGNKGQNEFPEYMKEKTATLFEDYEGIAFEDILIKIWPEAIKKDLLLIDNNLKNNKKYIRKCQQELKTSMLWSEITRDIGYPTVVKEENYKEMYSSILNKLL